MKYLTGTQLSLVDQQRVKNKFVHRYTKSHKPDWVTQEPVQFESDIAWRSEEHTSELQSHSFISYAVFCLKKKKMIKKEKKKK